jgi:hypothetical protein
MEKIAFMIAISQYLHVYRDPHRDISICEYKETINHDYL